MSLRRRTVLGQLAALGGLGTVACSVSPDAASTPKPTRPAAPVPQATVAAASERARARLAALSSPDAAGFVRDARPGPLVERLTAVHHRAAALGLGPVSVLSVTPVAARSTTDAASEAIAGATTEAAAGATSDAAAGATSEAAAGATADAAVDVTSESIAGASVTTPATVTVEVVAETAVSGVDVRPRRFIVRDHYDAETLELVGSEPVGRPMPWDLDGLEVVRSGDIVLLAPTPSAPGATALSGADLAARAADALAVVAAWWRPVRPVLLVLPTTDADAAALLGRTAAELSTTPAITDGPLTPGQPAPSDRVVLVPSVFASLPPAGQAVVLRHELTHAVIRADTTRPVPLWLSEGMAELVAYEALATTLTPAQVAPQLAELVRTGTAPAHIPTDDQLSPATASTSSTPDAGPDSTLSPTSGPVPDTRSVMYAAAWLAVRALVREGGIDGPGGVVSFYRQAAGLMPATPAELTDPATYTLRALRQVMGLSPARLEQLWRAELDLLR